MCGRTSGGTEGFGVGADGADPEFIADPVALRVSPSDEGARSACAGAVYS